MLLCAISLGGCSASFKSKRPAAALYTLDAGDACGKVSAVKAAHTIIIPMPQTPPGFESDRIALHLAGGRRLDYFAGAAWASDFSALLQDFIVRSTRHSCSGIIAATSDSDMPAAYSLIVKVNDFQPVYAALADTAPNLRVSLTFTLVSLREKKPVLDFTLSGRRMAQANRLTAITAGLEELLRGVLAEAFAKVAPHIRGT